MEVALWTPQESGGGLNELESGPESSPERGLLLFHSLVTGKGIAPVLLPVGLVWVPVTTLNLSSVNESVAINWSHSPVPDSHSLLPFSAKVFFLLHSCLCFDPQSGLGSRRNPLTEGFPDLYKNTQHTVFLFSTLRDRHQVQPSVCLHQNTRFPSLPTWERVVYSLQSCCRRRRRAPGPLASPLLTPTRGPVFRRRMTTKTTWEPSSWRRRAGRRETG